MRDTIRWGVMGTGWIAEKFCGALRSLEGYGAQLYAVGSRKKETAEAVSFFRGIIAAYTVPVTVMVAVPGTMEYAPVAVSWVTVAAGTVTTPATVENRPVAAS